MPDAENDVRPFEARGLHPTLTGEGAGALHDVMTAVNGFYYPGDRSDAVAAAVAWLQGHPEACAALGLGDRSSAPAPEQGTAVPKTLTGRFYAALTEHADCGIVNVDHGPQIRLTCGIGVDRPGPESTRGWVQIHREHVAKALAVSAAAEEPTRAEPPAETGLCLCLFEDGVIVRTVDLCPFHSMRPGVRDPEEPCIADPDWQPDEYDLARREGRGAPSGTGDPGA